MWISHQEIYLILTNVGYNELMPVQFEESSIQQTISSSSIKKTGKFGQFLVEKGIAKDEKQADIIMISIAVCFFALAIAWPFIF